MGREDTTRSPTGENRVLSLITCLHRKAQMIELANRKGRLHEREELVNKREGPSSARGGGGSCGPDERIGGRKQAPIVRHCKDDRTSRGTRRQTLQLHRQKCDMQRATIRRSPRLGKPPAKVVLSLSSTPRQGRRDTEDTESHHEACSEYEPETAGHSSSDYEAGTTSEEESEVDILDGFSTDASSQQDTVDESSTDGSEEEHSDGTYTYDADTEDDAEVEGMNTSLKVQPKLGQPRRNPTRTCALGRNTAQACRPSIWDSDEMATVIDDTCCSETDDVLGEESDDTEEAEQFTQNDTATQLSRRG